MKRILDKAQLDAARLEPEVNKIYDALTGDNGSAENDRPKLTGLRWQVAYDTALGRAAAAKVRIDGYNAMLAALKRGKNFENAASTTWLLEPADTIETGSAMQKLADKARAIWSGCRRNTPAPPGPASPRRRLRRGPGRSSVAARPALGGELAAVAGRPCPHVLALAAALPLAAPPQLDQHAPVVGLGIVDAHLLADGIELEVADLAAL